MTLKMDARITRFKRKIKHMKSWRLFKRKARQYEALDYMIVLGKGIKREAHPDQVKARLLDYRVREFLNNRITIIRNK